VKYHAVIFDLFGTLVDIYSTREYEQVLSEMAAALCADCEGFARAWFGTLTPRVTGALPTVEATVKYVCQALGVPSDAVQTAEAAGIRLAFTRRALAPRRDAVATLAALKATGRKTGLISDCSAEVPLLWPQTPFAPLVDVPVFSCVAGFRKPDPRIYRLACDGLGVAPQSCLYVGDGNSGELAGATKAGMSAVLIRAPYEDPDDSYRPEEETWDGPAISALEDVLTLVE